MKIFEYTIEAERPDKDSWQAIVWKDDPKKDVQDEVFCSARHERRRTAVVEAIKWVAEAL